MDTYDVVIIGGGPAGLTTGLYTSRAGLRSLLIERGIFGGQMVNARKVENYPGFPKGIAGIELSSLMQEQAVKYGLQTLFAEAKQVIPGKPMHRVLTTEGNILEAKAIVIATGSQYRKLDIPGEKEFLGRGVSYCATCDGFFFRDQDVAVVGGGDTAISDALDLAEIARKVYVIHRRNQLRASLVLQQRAFNHPKIQFIWDTIAEEISGDQTVNLLKLRNVRTEKRDVLRVAGVFVAVGLIPNSQPFAGVLKIDENGYIVADSHLATSTAGIYAAGDVRQNSPRQIASAVGDGATASQSVLRIIQSRA